MYLDPIKMRQLRFVTAAISPGVVSRHAVRASGRESRRKLDAVTRRLIALTAAALATTGLLAAAGTNHVAADTATSCPWLHSSASPQDRAAQVLAQMTLDEELSMTHGPRL